jgi:thiol-disulfide isomerase/thioredoxin
MRAILLAALFSGAGPAHANELILGKAAPELVLHTLDGKSISIHDLRGKVVIVTFWASWCEPCRKELPLLSTYATQHADGLRVLGFSLDDAGDVGKIRKVAASIGFPLGLLGSAWAGGYGRIWRIPVSFVIDREGRLVYDGWNSAGTGWTETELNRIVTPLLARQPDAQDSTTGTRGASAQSSS